MLKDLRNTIAAADSLAQDFVGAAALVAILVMALHLPVLI